jgi:hypothetical protein
MRIHSSAVSVLIAGLMAAAPAVADSVAVTSGPNGTVIVNGKPCRIVTTHDRNAPNTSSTSNSTSITTGPNGLSGSTTISPGGNSSSVTVGSGSTTSGTTSAAGSDCVIYRNEPGK